MLKIPQLQETFLGRIISERMIILKSGLPGSSSWSCGLINKQAWLFFQYFICWLQITWCLQVFLGISLLHMLGINIKVSFCKSKKKFCQVSFSPKDRMSAANRLYMKTCVVYAENKKEV